MKFGPFTRVKISERTALQYRLYCKRSGTIALTRRLICWRFSADVHFSTWVACLDGSSIIIDGRAHCAGVGDEGGGGGAEGGGVGDEGGGVGDGGVKICPVLFCYGGPHKQTYTKNKYNVLIGQNNISNLIIKFSFSIPFLAFLCISFCLSPVPFTQHALDPLFQSALSFNTVWNSQVVQYTPIKRPLSAHNLKKIRHIYSKKNNFNTML